MWILNTHCLVGGNTYVLRGTIVNGFDTSACSTHSTNYEIKLNYENNFSRIPVERVCAMWWLFFLPSILFDCNLTWKKNYFFRLYCWWVCCLNCYLSWSYFAVLILMICFLFLVDISKFVSYDYVLN